MHVKVKVQVYSLILSLKTLHPTLDFYPLVTEPVRSFAISTRRRHKVLQPFRRIELIVHIDIFVLPGTHLNPSQVNHVRVKILVQ